MAAQVSERARSRRRWLGVPALVVGIVVLAAACVPSSPEPPPPPPDPALYRAACDGTLDASTPGTIASPAIDELSGLAASRRTPGVWWAHNDSGDSARVFAVGDDGRDLGEFVLNGASAVDWEDIAVGPGPAPGTNYLYVGDIGGNVAPRSTVTVYRVPEPAVDTNAPSGAPLPVGGVDALTLQYPAGTYDAEALLVDPVSGELFVITKALGGTAQVFRAPAGLAGGSTTTLAAVRTVSLGFGGAVTAADVTAAGDVVALRTYFSVVLYPRPSGAPLADAFAQASCRGAAAAETQGEALGFTSDGRGYVTASEGAKPALHRFTAP